MKVPENERDFVQELKLAFLDLIEARNASPFHADKKLYQNDIESVLDSYLDYMSVQAL